uniref:Sprouty homolog 4 (Drosophila) n=1 Tax=Denticeps clupeoides TaxID=299321 RepID=A0AAY4EMI6_9TELE
RDPVPHHIPGVSSSIMVQPLLDSRVPYGRLQQPLAIYPIDQMKSLHVENDYIDSPAAVCQQPHAQKPAGRGPSEAHPHPQDSTHPWISFSGRPSSISSSSSTSSDQRLLDHAAPTPVLDSTSSVPPPPAASSRTPKPPSSKPADLKGPPAVEGKHLLLCERCGKCRCTECTLPRTLPSCLLCHQECLCSAQSLVDAATCMCLVKGVLYHCTDDEDDEGSCADRPCSCSQAHCCARWSFMAAVSVALPCLLCYLPAVGCTKLSQRCYDGVRRPGCRCKAPNPSKGMAGVPGAASAKEKPAS